MDIRIIDTIYDVSAAQWNALHDNRNPFVTHEFLSSLEQEQCVGNGTGWEPRIIIAEQDGQVVGAVPMYLKYHSMGEFVFDWAWAGAYSRSGLEYYPKLVIAIPYTPVTGPRLLLADNPKCKHIADAMIEFALKYARSREVSSMHWLFPDERDTQRLLQHDLLLRTDCQFHWRNDGYSSFDDFLSRLSSHKRKKVKRERRYVEEQGIRCQVIERDEIVPSHLDTIYEFYQSTFYKKGHIAPLTRGFFKTLGEKLPRSVVLIFAFHGSRCVAGAFFMRGPDTLYGRYWGCKEEFHSLHFELCYYRAIDYCIAHGIEHLEAGAQGEHKLMRGFYPTQTRSLHWIAHPGFRRAIEDYLMHETHEIEFYMDQTEKHLPYKSGS